MPQIFHDKAKNVIRIRVHTLVIFPFSHKQPVPWGQLKVRISIFILSVVRFNSREVTDLKKISGTETACNQLIRDRGEKFAGEIFEINTAAGISIFFLFAAILHRFFAVFCGRMSYRLRR